MRVRQVVPKDAIPSVDEPAFGPEYDGAPDDEVIVVDADPPRAYPLRVLHFHEIVNDAIEPSGGATDDPSTDPPAIAGPIAVTWCPLCGSAVVYDRGVDGRTLTFGVSGKLADDDLVMYDRETGSEWKQSTGECIAGPLEGATLDARPAGTTTVDRFRDAHPDGRILQPPGGRSEASEPGDEPAPIEYGDDPYQAYFEADGFGLGAHRGGQGRDWNREDPDPKDVVVGIECAGEVLGVPVARIEEAGGVLPVEVGEESVVLFAGRAGVHGFRDPGHEFGRTADGRFRGDGTVWDPATGRAEDDRRLERLPIRRLFAFAWQDDHGPDSFYEPGHA